MAGFSSTADYVDAHEAGQTFYSAWRKVPAQATVAGIWTDLSMALVSDTLNGNAGLRHGGNVAPKQKHLHRFMAMTATATALPLYTIVLDYLLYYPFVDMGVSEDQPMNDGVPAPVGLPRYTDGKGVEIMPVITNSPSAPTGLTFTLDYVNQDGVAKTTPSNSFGGGTTAGSLATTDRAVANAPGPFVTLAAGDTGVQSITAFRMTGSLDVGLISLVLVKPLAQHSLRGIDAPVEVDYMTDFPVLPKIEDGAYLNMITCPTASLAGTAIIGDISTVWSN
jgi:hypothetical protein